MLETTKDIEGKQAKELENACKQYLDACTIIKDQEKVKKSADAFIKSVCTEIGEEYATNNFVISMSHTGARETVDLRAIKKADIELYILLKEKGYVKVSKDSLKIGSVTPKFKV